MSVNPKFAYVLNYFRKLYQLPPEVDIGYGTKDHKINIHDCRTAYFESLNPFPENNLVEKTWQNTRIPFLFAESSAAEVLTVDSGRAFIHYDVLAASFFFLSSWQEYEYMRRHNTVRYPYEASFQKKYQITQIPIVNYYFDIIKTAVEHVYGISLTVLGSDSRPFSICLTHDIDKCYTGWQQDLFSQIKKKKPGAAFHILRQRASGKDTWFNFKQIMDLEKKYSAYSSFYFIGRYGKQFAVPDHDVEIASPKEKIRDPEYFYRPSPFARFQGYTETLQNADYDLSAPEMQSVQQNIRRHGSEVGIHGSFGSSLDLARLQEDLQHFPFPVTGGRFHYLNFDITNTFDILETLEMKYDSTLGFAEKSGFRNGIAFPFVPYNIPEDRPYRLIEIPLIVMDTTFRSYRKTPLPEIFPEINSLMKTVAQFQGCLTVLWHNAYFSPYKFAGWGEIYEKILQSGQAENAALVSGERVFEQWQGILT